MERYESYKDSGVKWIGEIPGHWEVTGLKRISSIILGKMLENAPEGQGLPYLCAKDVHMYNIDFSSLKKMHFSKKEKERYEIKRGDMLVVEGGAAGSSAIVKSDVKDVYIQNSIMITRCNNSKMINDYACYVLNSMTLRGYSESICNKATIMHFTKEKLGDTIITVPPIKEQITIVNYLDSVTSKIDEEISQQRKMIDLLNERKQIIIQNAVTKGLDPNVKMKDSGVEWIGEIPEDWKIDRFKNLFKTRTGVTFTKKQIVEYGERVISYGQIHSKDNYGTMVNSDLIRFIPSKLTKKKEKSLAYEGDFLFADTSEDLEGCGNNIFIDCKTPIYAGYHTILAKKNNNEIGQYLAYLFASRNWRWQVRSLVNGVKVFSITQTILKSVYVILPPVEEQLAIVHYLNIKVGNIEKIIKSIENYISLLQERKQIIINDVVTGKVKVV